MMSEKENSVSHVADFYNRYPGEEVIFSTLLKIEDIGRVTSLLIQLPEKISLTGFQCKDPSFTGVCRVTDTSTGTQLLWELAGHLSAGSQIEWVTHCVVQIPEFDQYLQSHAILLDDQGSEICSDYARVSVKLQGNYLNYMPEIYRQDDLMGRFLMLFESFWKPIDTQIRQIACYFDPDLTPEKMLPWLASWVGAYWDETLPDQRKRSLLRNAVLLYQRRGTKEALKTMLNIYTNSEVHINEHPANNFQIGAKAHLGPRIALGTQNFPHTFSVSVQIDPNDFIFPDNLETGKLEKWIKQNLDTIIEAQKPAHTAHTLKLTLKNTRNTQDKLQLESRKDLP